MKPVLLSAVLFAQANPKEFDLPSALASWICAGLIISLILIAIGGLILQLACRMVGVPVPKYEQATNVVFLTALCNVLVSCAIGFVVFLGKGEAALHDLDSFQQLLAISNLFSLPLNLLVSAGCYSAMLKDVTYPRGLLLWFLVCVLIVAFYLGALFALFLLALVLHR